MFFSVPYLAKYHGGERFNTDSGSDWIVENGVETETTRQHVLCKLVPTSLFVSLVRKLSY